ncbi:MAG: hypothetical protein AUK44_07260 [Porphyromonadaceae bacterium CG2_30_38_12]|nr:MAG: hypothetical protein AUK44_07260 [Porphyromonadaceae bacterium CG2_30_38_12]
MHVYLSKRFVVRLFIVLLTGITQHVEAQEWNAAHLHVLYGSSLPLNFNTLTKIKAGIEVSIGTRFGISLADSSVVGHQLQGFVLYCRAFNNQANIKGDAYTLPLNKIKLKAENVIGLETGTSYGYKDLSVDWVPLFTYTNLSWTDLSWATHQLNIAYQCGKSIADGGNGTLMGEEPDYYNVEIEFELVPTGPGF